MNVLRLPNNPIDLRLDLDDVEYLLSFLDEEPQDSKAYAIREEILLQVYD
jgi:hypothetical protein